MGSKHGNRVYIQVLLDATVVNSLCKTPRLKASNLSSDGQLVYEYLHNTQKKSCEALVNDKKPGKTL